MALGTEAKKIAMKMDSLIMPANKEAAEEEKRIKKKVMDHKKALNMLPDAEMFK